MNNTRTTTFAQVRLHGTFLDLESNLQWRKVDPSHATCVSAGWTDRSNWLFGQEDPVEVEVFPLTLIKARAAFEADEYHRNYLNLYGDAAFRVWLRVWWTKTFDAAFPRFEYPYGRRIGRFDLHRMVRLYVAWRVAHRLNLGTTEAAYELPVSDVVKWLALLGRHFDCLPVIDGVLTREYWERRVTAYLDGARRLFA
jgi:hypothetical protein